MIPRYTSRLRKAKKGKKNYYLLIRDPRRCPVEKSIALKTSRKDVANQKAREFLALIDAGEFDPWNQNRPLAADVSFKEACELFYRAKSDVRPKTMEAYKGALNGLGGLLSPDMMLRSIAEKHALPYIEDTTVKQGTRRHRYTHLRVFFNWAKASKLLDKSPLDNIPLPKKKTTARRALTPGEIKKVFDGIDKHMEEKGKYMRPGEVVWLKDVITVALFTGLRRGELFNLHWSDIDFDSRFIDVRNREGFRTKTGDERRIPLPGNALAVLKRLNDTRTDAEEGPVWIGPRGVRIDPERASKLLKKFFRMAGLPEELTFHSLRRTCASWLAENGVPFAVIQGITGHSNKEMTDIYIAVSPDGMLRQTSRVFDKESFDF